MNLTKQHLQDLIDLYEKRVNKFGYWLYRKEGNLVELSGQITTLMALLNRAR